MDSFRVFNNAKLTRNDSGIIEAADQDFILGLPLFH
ncbi:hypothetical protein J2T12_000005 [Paenibacillus anaericanus]|nr:hypothetical protein [Paenibacillus anaericanus]